VRGRVQVEATVDGAYLGTGFPQMVFVSRPEFRPPRSEDRYAAKINGFQRVHKSATDYTIYIIKILGANDRKDRIAVVEDSVNISPKKSIRRCAQQLAIEIATSLRRTVKNDLHLLFLDEMETEEI